jgi:hypothetical protein
LRGGKSRDVERVQLKRIDEGSVLRMEGPVAISQQLAMKGDRTKVERHTTLTIERYCRFAPQAQTPVISWSAIPFHSTPSLLQQYLEQAI